MKNLILFIIVTISFSAFSAEEVSLTCFNKANYDLEMEFLFNLGQPVKVRFNNSDWSRTGPKLSVDFVAEVDGHTIMRLSETGTLIEIESQVLQGFKGTAKFKDDIYECN